MKHYHSIVSALVIVVFAANIAAQKRSTPEERAKVVELARRLEADPLGKGRKEDRHWFREWTKNTRVRSIPSCPKPFETEAPNKYAEELSLQFSISTAAFMIEHAQQAGNPEARLLAGTRGMLKAYSSILEEQPGSTSQFLDTLVTWQNNHQLEQSVREIMVRCSDVPLSDKNRPLPTGEKIYAPLEVEGLPYISSLPMPAYVATARNFRVTGNVVLHVVLGADGKVGDIEVVKGLSHGLSESSIEAARRIRFEPASIGGKPVPVMLWVEYKFESR